MHRNKDRRYPITSSAAIRRTGLDIVLVCASVRPRSWELHDLGPFLDFKSGL